MKKFSFSLQKLFDYQEQLLRKEKNTLGELRAARDALVAEKEQCENKLHEANEAFLLLMQRGLNTNEILMHKRYMNNLNTRIKELMSLIEAADGRVSKQLQVVVGISQEVNTLDKLREKQLDDYKAAFQKEEERFIEEYVSNTSFRAGG